MGWEWLYQATRPKDLVTLLHAAGHTVSNDTGLRVDPAIANDILHRYQDHGEVLIPRNFFQGTQKGYIRVVIDNFDINK